MRIHLDDADEENGALRVVPWSHKPGRILEKEIARHVDEGGVEVCRVQVGDIMLMRPLLPHSSRRALKPIHRRVIHIEYANHDLPSPLEWYERNWRLETLNRFEYGLPIMVPCHSGKKRILIVEDEPAIAENIAFAVGTENMEPICVGTAGAAWEVLEGQAIDLVVLDVGLPDENGFDFCRHLRTRSDIPIIFLTAREDEVDRIVGLELGADDYVTKPFSPRELTARIRAILRRTNGHFPAANYTAPPSLFKVDQTRKLILYKGHSLNLSRYEFRMLELMIRHPGQVFSREQLMDHAWEEPEASSDRTVDTHIKTLRSKLREIDPESDCLQTRRGWGYCLKVEP